MPGKRASEFLAAQRGNRHTAYRISHMGNGQPGHLPGDVRDAGRIVRLGRTLRGKRRPGAAVMAARR